MYVRVRRYLFDFLFVCLRGGVWVSFLGPRFSKCIKLITLINPLTFHYESLAVVFMTELDDPCLKFIFGRGMSHIKSISSYCSGGTDKTDSSPFSCLFI